VAYAALGSLFAVLLGRPLVGLNYEQSDREANFRGDLVHVRENAELVAMLQREPHLRSRLRARLAALVENSKRIIAVHRTLAFFTTGYNYFLQLIPVLIVAPLFMRGTAEFGVISQASMAFAHLLGAFSLVITQFPQLSSYAAVMERLNALSDAAEVAARPDRSAITFVEDPQRLALERLTLQSAHDDKILVRDLSIEVPPGARVVVRVASPAVAAALQRAIAGIWENGTGRIVRPPRDSILLIPERPYLPPGTLRQILLRPDRIAATSESEIWAALRTAGAQDTVLRAGGLDVERDWDDLLSLDEQRLIGIARVLLATPQFAVLAFIDEALGRDSAQHLLALLAERQIGCLELAGKGRDRQGVAMTVDVAADGSCEAHPEAGH
jgi:putative ATP-binding cassette transporter